MLKFDFVLDDEWFIEGWSESVGEKRGNGVMCGFGFCLGWDKGK
jgi:hypothetical protein